MVSQLSEFQYFVDIFWRFFVGFLAVRVICWVFGNYSYWINKSFGD